MWVRDLQKTFSLSIEFNKTRESLGVYEHEDGYLGCKGRLDRGKLPFDTKLPILLPNSHHFTDLVVQSAYETVYHNGVRETQLEIRLKYWISKGRQTVKRFLNKCLLCEKLEGLPYPSPAVSDLPKFRVVGGRAFKATGVDLCGPVYTKVHPKGKQMTKNYISITTCASSRMIHFEILPYQTSAAYLQSQRSFITRREIPKLIVSDNWKTFKGRALKQFNAKRGIKWRYNLSQAPWWGGLFEPLIGSVKRCLIKSVIKMKLTYEELTTVTSEVEAVVNNWSLTCIYEDEVEEVLTPSHLYCGRQLLDEKNNESSDEDITEINTAENSAKRWRHMNKIIERFWRKCRKSI